MFEYIRWLQGLRARPEEAKGGQGQDKAMFSTRMMVEPIRLETSVERQMALLRAVGVTGRSKAELVRAAIALALPTLEANPDMIDILQPGWRDENDGLGGDVAHSVRPSPARGNGR